METLDESHAGPAILSKGDPPVPRAQSLRIAYLLSQYPAISHTFFLHEVLGLRARGLHIETASINPPDRPLSKLPPQEASESRATRYVKSGPRWKTVGLLLATVFTRPGVVLRGVSSIANMPDMSLRQRAFWLLYLAEALIVGRWMLERKLDHLHVHFGGPVASVGMLVCASWNIPFSLTIHGPEELLNSESYQLREKIDRASFVLCISDFCRSQLCQLTPAESWSKFKVVRLGVDPMILRPSQRPAEPAQENPHRPLVLVCTGRLVPAKGHHVLLQALEQVRQTSKQPIHATLIGDGPERRSLEEFVRHHHMADAVTFTSALSHPETLRILRKADLFALASFAEGIPVALMEAMALGLPCVSTAISGIPELIRNGQDGLLVAPGNVEALANALASLARDPVLRKQLGCSGRRRILTDYNLPLNQEHLAHTLEQLILPAKTSICAQRGKVDRTASTDEGPR